MRKEIGRVTEEERDELQRLFERRNGLNELAAVLTADNTELYERLVSDIGLTSMRFQQWWDTMSVRYRWESDERGRWEIDFQICKIYLVIPE